MMRMAMSPAAAGLLRAILRRAGVERDRILLTEFRSHDWQSLTFVGEQHRMRLRIPAPGADEIAARLLDDLSDCEISIPGHVVADVAVTDDPERHKDGSIVVTIEALTVED